MKTYILFLFASFNDLEDLEFFCFEHFPHVSSGGIKYVIVSNGNSIIIFDSDKEKDDLVKSLHETLSIEQIGFYMIFEREAIFWAELPKELNNFMFKPKETKPEMFKINTKDSKIEEKSLDTLILDDILEKIQNEGIDSLSEDEKNFLDNFGN